MCSALELFKHFVSLFEVPRFAEKFRPNTNERVCAQDERIRKSFCHCARFSVRIDLRDFLGRQLAMVDLPHVAGNDLEFVTQLPKQFGPSRRHRRKYEWRHMLNAECRFQSAEWGDGGVDCRNEEPASGR